MNERRTTGGLQIIGEIVVRVVAKLIAQRREGATTDDGRQILEPDAVSRLTGQEADAAQARPGEAQAPRLKGGAPEDVGFERAGRSLQGVWEGSPRPARGRRPKQNWNAAEGIGRAATGPSLAMAPQGPVAAQDAPPSSVATAASYFSCQAASCA